MNSLEGSRVLVTGAAGFIGSHLADALLQQGVGELILVDDLSNGVRRNLDTALADPRARLEQSDFGDTGRMRALLRGVDYVLHFAAVKHGASHADREALFATNVRGMFELVSACADAGVRRLVFASSLYVYGVESKQPFRETDELKSHTLYGASKIFGEHLLRAAHTQQGLSSVSLRFFFVYGPRLYQRRYAYAFVGNTLRAIREGRPPVVFGDGRQVFDYVYIDDAVDATLATLRSDVSNCAINIGTGTGTSILDLCRGLIERCGSSLTPVFGPPDETAGTVRVADPTLAEALLGFRARVSVQEGFFRVVEWWNRESGGLSP